MDTCGICREKRADLQCCFANCTHWFDAICLQPWIESGHNYCPYCLQECDILEYSDGTLKSILSNSDDDNSSESFCGICESEIEENEEIGFMFNCENAGIDHQFHMTCLCEHIVNYGPRCPECGSFCIHILSGNHEEIVFNRRTQDFIHLATNTIYLFC
ncbi:hypothetical protein B4U80_14405 [Leptotrombidium deliense]|uniref:RING-type domain-containing protein n=1 Tax=Leptotrombidium deliense TaxID=299467 RepID=A0A443RW22_9ACAR|nr:hypothetical protein B4U80_14405 [Leptotrombidium deliense]